MEPRSNGLSCNLPFSPACDNRRRRHQLAKRWRTSCCLLARVAAAGLFGVWGKTGIAIVTAMIAPDPMAVQEIGHQDFVIRRDRRLEHFLDFLALAGHHIDAECAGQND